MTNTTWGRRDFLKSVIIGSASMTWGCGAPDLTTDSKGFFSDETLPVPSIESRPRRQSPSPAKDSPNLLLITVDDMSCDSVGAYGCPLPHTTPNIDRLASEGIRFEHAHVNISVCQPCRGVLATGRYSHRNGMEGFEHSHLDIPTVMQTLQDAGYRTGVLGKVTHSTPHTSFKWNMRKTKDDLGEGRNPKRYYAHIKRFIKRCQKSNRPFYLVANAQDPHRPFTTSHVSISYKGRKIVAPSRVFQAEGIPVPGFLPDLPNIRSELSYYYNSVRRADDTVGAILRALQESGEAENTIVHLVSDNGMSFPFGKGNCYPESTRTPWIVRWPGTICPGSIDRQHFISTIDFMPTALESLGIGIPSGLDGTSFVPLLNGHSLMGRERVYTQFHRTAKNGCYPMRSVQEKQYCYVLNPWSNGKRIYRSESMSGYAFDAMEKEAKTNPDVAKRVDMLRYRAMEELYDLQSDPNCLNNLANRENFQNEKIRLKSLLHDWMLKTGDHAVACFQGNNLKTACRKYYRSIEHA